MNRYDVKTKLEENVYRARDHDTNQEVILKTSSPSRLLELCNEITILSQLDHPNVIHLYNSFVYQGNLYAVEEAGHMDLYTILSTYQGRRMIEHRVKNNIVEPIIYALQYLHQKGIIHRDVKPENIIVTLSGKTKLCDFGLACLKSIENSRYCGTKEFLAPEIIRGQDYDEKVDIWALGCVIYEVLYGTQYYNSSIGFIDIRNVSSEAIRFTRHCLIVNPLLRPSATKLLTKLWFVEEKPQMRTSLSLTDISVPCPKRRSCIY